MLLFRVSRTLRTSFIFLAAAFFVLEAILFIACVFERDQPLARATAWQITVPGANETCLYDSYNVGASANSTQPCRGDDADTFCTTWWCVGPASNTFTVSECVVTDDGGQVAAYAASKASARWHDVHLAASGWHWGPKTPDAHNALVGVGMFYPLAFFTLLFVAIVVEIVLGKKFILQNARIGNVPDELLAEYLCLKVAPTTFQRITCTCAKTGVLEKSCIQVLVSMGVMSDYPYGRFAPPFFCWDAIDKVVNALCDKNNPHVAFLTEHLNCNVARPNSNG